MGRTTFTEPQCLYKGALYLFTLIFKRQYYLISHVVFYERTICHNIRRVKFKLEIFDYEIISRTETQANK